MFLGCSFLFLVQQHPVPRFQMHLDGAAPRPKSEASCAPASVEMLMLLPSELPMFAPISFAASISIEPGMKIPACPSLSYTSSFTGMMLPPCSSEVMPMPSLSPCNRAAPTRSVFRGRRWCFFPRLPPCRWRCGNRSSVHLRSPR